MLPINDAVNRALSGAATAATRDGRPEDATRIAALAEMPAVLWRVGDAYQERAAGLIHTYRLEAIDPHTTRTGHHSLLLRWRGSCAVCGVAFVTLSGRRPHELVRTCLDHRGMRRRGGNG